jgi:hypothetical protein
MYLLKAKSHGRRRNLITSLCIYPQNNNLEFIVMAFLNQVSVAGLLARADFIWP